MPFFSAMEKKKVGIISQTDTEKTLEFVKYLVEPSNVSLILYNSSIKPQPTLFHKTLVLTEI